MTIEQALEPSTKPSIENQSLEQDSTPSQIESPPEASVLQQLQLRQMDTAGIMNLLAQHRMLPQLYQEVILDQAIVDIHCTPEEAQQAQKRFYAAQGITDSEQQKAWLQQQQMSEEHAAWMVIRQFRIEKFKQATWGHKLESHFLSCKSQLDQVVYSLLRVAETSTAQELFFRIKAGEQDFASAARTYSTGSEAETGGLLGPMPLSQPHATLAAKLKSAQVGQLLAPFPLGDRMLLVRLEKLIPARLDDATRQKLLDNLFQTWLKDSARQAMTA